MLRVLFYCYMYSSPQLPVTTTTTTIMPFHSPILPFSHEYSLSKYCLSELWWLYACTYSHTQLTILYQVPLSSSSICSVPSMPFFAIPHLPLSSPSSVHCPCPLSVRVRCQSAVRCLSVVSKPPPLLTPLYAIAHTSIAPPKKIFLFYFTLISLSPHIHRRKRALTWDTAQRIVARRVSLFPGFFFHNSNKRLQLGGNARPLLWLWPFQWIATDLTVIGNVCRAEWLGGKSLVFDKGQEYFYVWGTGYRRSSFFFQLSYSTMYRTILELPYRYLRWILPIEKKETRVWGRDAGA